MTVKTQTFRGKKYKIFSESIAGRCEPPGYRGPALLFPRGISDNKDSLNTVIHEALHACFLYQSEDSVTKSADGISNFLWRLGYRKVK